MRLVHFEKGGVHGIGADEGSGWHGLTQRESGFPGTLPELIYEVQICCALAETFWPCPQST